MAHRNKKFFKEKMQSLFENIKKTWCYKQFLICSKLNLQITQKMYSWWRYDNPYNPLAKNQTEKQKLVDTKGILILQISSLIGKIRSTVVNLGKKSYFCWKNFSDYKCNCKRQFVHSSSINCYQIAAKCYQLRNCIVLFITFENFLKFKLLWLFASILAKCRRFGLVFLLFWNQLSVDIKLRINFCYS